MDEKLNILIKQVSKARQELVQSVMGLSHQQAHYKPSPETWSVVDNVEHLYWAEIGGVNGIWKTLEAVKNNKPHWTGDRVHEGLSIEVIVEKTWQPREIAPEIAKPKWGGSLQFWIASLNSCQPVLEAMGQALNGMDLKTLIHPHPISGPLNVYQRMEFLRFHINRHHGQIEKVISHSSFP